MSDVIESCFLIFLFLKCSAKMHLLSISADFLKTDLENYIVKTWPDGIVRLVRTNERSGLIRAKIAGAKAAEGEVLIFLDSHCEANAGW